jgi:hypothetical protein
MTGRQPISRELRPDRPRWGSSERPSAKDVMTSDTLGMDALESFAAVYGEYARTCIEIGVRPLSPEELAALLAAIDIPDDHSLH